MSAIERATVLTHRTPVVGREPLRALFRAADAAGVTLRFDKEETARHGLVAAPGVEVDAPLDRGVDLCLVLGGDGTTLSGLRAYAGTGVPVYGVNFGEVGFLTTVDRDDLDGAFARAFAGDFDRLPLPAITVPRLQGHPIGAYAINDVSVHRKVGRRVAELAYALGPDEIGRVRCDGLVVATAAGSTGYNLANGGPVMAWGVEGYAVSFIAPHSLTARALVVAPDDSLRILNASRDDAVDVVIDGRPSGELEPGEWLEVSFTRAVSVMAQLPGATFYHRLRDRFGRLAR